MLSEKSRPIIEATLPVIGARIGHITPKFYNRMFTARPDLLDGLFSRSNQKNGTQQQALAGSIAAFATHLIEHPDTVPESVLNRIAHKHTSLGIVEGQYPIVYEHLFAAIAEDLGDAVTPEVAAAWTEVYWLMADALITIEKGLYAQQANDKMWTNWTLASKDPVGVDAMTFRFTPADDTPVTLAKVGQFVSVRVRLEDGIRQCRQYTLSGDVADTTQRVVTVKRDDAGEVSPFLHNTVQVGDTVELSNPYGDLVLEEGDTPLVIATAGIGCTPAAAALQSLAESGSTRPVMVLHADRTEQSWALRDQMKDSINQLDNVETRVWLEDMSTLSDGETATKGIMDISTIKLPDNASVYLCGPLPFMRSVRSQAIHAGVAPRNIHYEIFGPDLWLAAKGMPDED